MCCVDQLKPPHNPDLRLAAPEGRFTGGLPTFGAMLGHGVHASRWIKLIRTCPEATRQERHLPFRAPPHPAG